MEIQIQSPNPQIQFSVPNQAEFFSIIEHQLISLLSPFHTIHWKEKANNQVWLPYFCLSQMKFSQELGCLFWGCFSVHFPVYLFSDVASFKKFLFWNRMQSHCPVIPARRLRLRQVYLKFETSLSCVARPVSTKQNNPWVYK